MKLYRTTPIRAEQLTRENLLNFCRLYQELTEKRPTIDLSNDNVDSMENEGWIVVSDFTETDWIVEDHMPDSRPYVHLLDEDFQIFKKTFDSFEE